MSEVSRRRRSVGFGSESGSGATTSIFTVLGGIFVAAGLGLLVLAIRHLLDRRAFLRTSAITTGVVVALAERQDQDETSYFPTVRFKTATGREVTFTSGVGSGKESWRIGDSTSVRYQRDRPDAAEVSSLAALWGPSLLFALLGVAFLFIGVGVLTGWIPVSAPTPR